MSCDILAIGSHPDDLEYGMGGSLLKLASSKTIVMVHLTQGEMGTYGSREIRKKEARNAAKIIGAEMELLDLGDSQIVYTLENRMKILELIRKHKPTVIFAPYYGNQTTHPDHRNAGLLVKDAIKLAGLKKLGEAHKVNNIIYYMLPHTLKPTFVIDVSNQEQKMLELWKAYASQIPCFHNDFKRLLSFRTRWNWRSKAKYAEAFYCDEPINATELDILKF